MKNRFLVYLYYGVLLVVYAMRQSIATEPPLMYRLLFIAALFSPLFIWKQISYPAILTMFLCLTISGMGYSYLPYTLSLYVIITIFFSFILRQPGIYKQNIPPILSILTLYVFIVDLLTGTLYDLPGSHIFESIFFCFLIITLFLSIIGDNEEVHLKQFSICFAASTIVLSVLFLTIGRQMYVNTVIGLEEERVTWTDPNYLGMVIGMGTVIGFIQLFSNEWRSLSIVEKAVYIIAIVISIPVLLLNASRGAVLSIVVAFSILVFVSKTKKVYKILIVAIAIVGLYYLYSNEYMNILVERIEHDDGTGSNRTLIWASKLKAYSEGNPLQILFGMGHAAGGYAGGQLVGFHNDYIGFLVDYGILGLCFLLYLLYYPFKIVPSKSPNRSVVIVLLIYIATCFMTLEPFLTGILTYFVFYLYAFLIARNERKKFI